VLQELPERCSELALAELSDRALVQTLELRYGAPEVAFCGLICRDLDVVLLSQVEEEAVGEDISKTAATDQSTGLLFMIHEIVLVSGLLEGFLAAQLALLTASLVLYLFLQQKKQEERL
jgi:hypothetical protein